MLFHVSLAFAFLKRNQSLFSFTKTSLPKKMQRKRLPIFQKVSNFLKVSIFVAKMRRPIIPKLVFLKKSRKVEKFKLLKHYNNGFVQEYQFSPSSTPLIHYYGDQFKSRSRRDVYSILFSCRCLGSFREEEGDWNRRLEEILPAIGGQFTESLDWSDEDDSINQRAEMFIQNFYEEMKMERQASV